MLSAEIELIIEIKLVIQIKHNSEQKKRITVLYCVLYTCPDLTRNEATQHYKPCLQHNL